MSPDPPDPPDRRDPDSTPVVGPEPGKPADRPPTQEEMDSAPTLPPAGGLPATEKPTLDAAPSRGTAAGIPRTLGPYQILSEIGRGGMGVVYRAFHPGLKRTVALKVLVAGEDASEASIARFHHEAEAVAKLGHHPNIVPVYDIGQVTRDAGGEATGRSPLHYFAMHYVEGKSLDKVIDGGELAPTEAASIALKVARALQHAHEHGILHRDVKPANILMAFPDRPDGASRQADRPDRTDGARGTGHGGPAENAESAERAVREPDEERTGRSGDDSPPAPRSGGSVSREAGSGESGIGEPMLTDFGLARDVESVSRMTATGTALGTPHYMPPEQARGRLEDTDERSDVYSLGATLYEMLTLQPPFEGNSIADILHKVFFEDPVAPRKRNRLVAKDLETLCLKCLEKSPERRYRSCRALAADLESFLEGEPILARPPGLGYRIARRIRRNKALAATTLGAALLLSAGAWIARGVVQKTEEKRETESVRADGERIRADKEREEREKAEGKEKEALRLLEKVRLGTRVILAANLRLAKAQSELREVFWKSRMDSAGKQAAFGRHEPTIESFVSGLANDETSRATGWAVKGWLLHLGARWKPAREAFKKSRELDPESPWADMFEAMVFLDAYLADQRMPTVRQSAKGIQFVDLEPESQAMGEAKKRYEKLLERAARSPLWAVGLEGKAEASSGKELMAVAEGLRRIHGERSAESIPALTLAMKIPELLWMRPQFLLARARILYLNQDFSGALSDAEELKAEGVASTDALFLKAFSISGIGLQDALKGGDPRPRYREAVRAMDEAVVLDPGLVEAHCLRGALLRDLGEEQGERGEDPRETLRESVESYRKALELRPGKPSELLGCGSSLAELAKAQAVRGSDPRQAYREALSCYDEALRLRPDYVPGRNNRADLLAALGMAAFHRGEDPSEHYEKAIEDLNVVLAAEPDMESAFSIRGTVHEGMGDWLALQSKDPRDFYDKAIRDHGEALRRNPAKIRCFVDRGNTYVKLGQAETALGVDARPSCRKAIENYDAYLERSPDSVQAKDNRASAYLRLGEAEEGHGKDPMECYRKAAEGYGEVLKTDPKRFGTRLNRSAAYLAMAKAEGRSGRDASAWLEKAIEDSEAAIAINDRIAEAHQNRAMAFHNLGAVKDARGEDPRRFWEQAIESYGNAARSKPRWWRPHADKGSLLQRLGRYDEAIEAYEKALAIVGDKIPSIRQALEQTREAKRLQGERKSD